MAIITKNRLAIAGLILTLWLAIIAIICYLIGIITDTAIVYASFVLHAGYLGVYFNRKFKAGKDGFDFSDDEGDK